MRNRVLSRRESEALINRLAGATEITPRLKAQLQSLPVMQQIALLQMHESQVKRAVIGKLQEDTQAACGFEDYTALRERGFATKNTADRWHSLTHAGREAAAHLETMLCKQFGLHLMLEAGDDRYTVRFRCCCGDWQTQSRKGDFTNSNARVSWHRHATNNLNSE